jgi:hypothetical protein
MVCTRHGLKLLRHLFARKEKKTARFKNMARFKMEALVHMQQL